MVPGGALPQGGGLERGLRYPRTLQPATFLRRYKRFFADVELDGQVVTTHIANTGAMTGCAEEGAPCRVFDSANPKRKLQYSLEQVCMDGHWIVVNSARSNAVVHEALQAGVVPELAASTIARERKLGDSRVDFLLDDRVWVEVKTMTLVKDGVASFPDAVTTRGTRHVRELQKAVEDGQEAFLFFLVAHEGAEVVTLAEDIDPTYAEAVRSAVETGVRVLARQCRMSDTELALGDPLPLQL